MLNVKRDYIKSKNTRSQNTGTRKNPPPGVFSSIPKKFVKENLGILKEFEIVFMRSGGVLLPRSPPRSSLGKIKRFSRAT